MGGKESRMGGKESRSSLNPTERRRLTEFLDARGSSSSQFNHQVMQKLWCEYLVPDLLKSFADYLMAQNKSNKEFIGIEEFVFIYSSLVRGSAEEKAETIAGMVGVHKNSLGHDVVSYHGLLKYFCNLVESYFKGLKARQNDHYVSWTHTKQPQQQNIHQVMEGVCCDLVRKADEVTVSDLEKWLNSSGIMSTLHSYVLGSLYNLEPETKQTVVPRATLPSTKTPLILDLSQVVYLNTFLPEQNKLKWRFLFSTETHGESFSKFVGCITMQGPILLVLEVDENCIFGGFISENLTVGPRWVGSEESFLFRVKPTVEVYPSTSYNQHYAYLNMHQSSLPNGLGMGGQHNYWGLWIDSVFGNGECSDSCTTYKNYKMLCSKKKFHIHRLEAWGVGERPPTSEEMGERSILDKDGAAVHIMEMAGHKMHSQGLRESKDKGTRGSPPKD